MSTTLVYDGTFDGFLCCVFYKYEYKIREVQINSNEATPSLLGEVVYINTSEEKAKRVWKGLQKRTSKKWCHKLFRAFLSETEQIEALLLYAIEIAFSQHPERIYDYGDKHLLKMAQLVKKVDREKHRMDAFVRFQLSKDNIYFATISPDFNVLPLNSKHFMARYADQQWLIFDLKRNYGIFYDLNEVKTITMQDHHLRPTNDVNEHMVSEREGYYQQLWGNYFSSTNIKERINLNLHIRHVPKRYWKFLTEKSLISKK